MTTNSYRGEMLLVLLSENGIPLDPESVAATYNTPVEEWQATFDRLEENGDIEQVADGLYYLTRTGQNKTFLRGSTTHPRQSVSTFS